MRWLEFDVLLFGTYDYDRWSGKCIAIGVLEFEHLLIWKYGYTWVDLVRFSWHRADL